MNGLIERPGIFRKEGVEIVKGAKIEHLAPPVENVQYLMNVLFNYIKTGTKSN